MAMVFWNEVLSIDFGLGVKISMVKSEEWPTLLDSTPTLLAKAADFFITPTLTADIFEAP